jgi:hypothetical protein
MKSVNDLKKLLSIYKQTNPLKEPTNSNYLTTSLFWETRKPDQKHTPIFTTKNHEHVVDGVEYISLKRIYMSYDHVPGLEYEFALDVFDNWEHWVYLAENSNLKHKVREWREELEIRIKAQAMFTILRQSRDKEKGFQAAKTLVTDEHKEKRRGRPSKEEVERQKKIAAGVNDTLAADMERLGLSVVR